MAINPERKYESIQSPESCMANEPAMAYQRRESDSGITRMTTRKELEAECFSLEESKNRLVEKIHRHFHRQS